MTFIDNQQVVIESGKNSQDLIHELEKNQHTADIRAFR